MLGQRSAQWGMFEADALYGTSLAGRTSMGSSPRSGMSCSVTRLRCTLLSRQRAAECAAEPAGHRAGAANV